MKITQRALISLAAALILSGLFAGLGFWRLFTAIETSFYQPARRSAIQQNLNGAALHLSLSIEQIQNVCAATLLEEPVLRSFLSNTTNTDLEDRDAVFNTLFTTVPGLEWVSFVESRSSKALYNKTRPGTNSESAEIPDIDPALLNRGNAQIQLDAASDTLLFSFPFSDAAEAYRGSAVFALQAGALGGWTIEGDPAVFVSAESSAGGAVFSAETDQGWTVIQEFPSNRLKLQTPLILLMCLAFFCSVFLLSFLLSSLAGTKETAPQLCEPPPAVQVLAYQGPSFLFAKPFSGQRLSEALNTNVIIIENKDGISYINKSILKQNPLDLSLDSEFKNLVDSVLQS
jgi:hypothetical protein